MRPKLVLIRGIPGAGKSTKAKAMVGYIHLENDQWLINSQGKYEWSDERRKEAVRKCMAATRDHLLAGHDVVVSNCFITKNSMLPYMKIAKEANADVEIVVCNGKYENVHNVPADVVSSMKSKFEE